MKKNNFVLVKDNLDGIQGDHLYLSDKLFNENENHFPAIKPETSWFLKRFFQPNKK